MKKVDTSTTRNGLAVRWVPVTTADGRVRPEMRWTAPHTLRSASGA
ncbi:MAG TPA: hypothetical protein VFU25_08645 [Ornithinibacter sp.]|nr:hypothetical protein [Ornithinibacter sp.]